MGKRGELTEDPELRSQTEDENQGSWLYGIAQYFNCGYEWVAVWPVRADHLLLLFRSLGTIAIDSHNTTDYLNPKSAF